MSGEFFSDKVLTVLTLITYKHQNIFRLGFRNFAVAIKGPSASQEQRKNNLRSDHVSL